MKICVVGSFMMDLVANAPRRPNSGETIIGTSFSMNVGGKGFNQAVAARRAGAEVSIVGCLGKDAFAEKFIDFMKAEDIDYSGVELNDEIGTGTGMPLIEENGQNSIVIIPQANLTVDEKFIERQKDKILAADIIVMQLEIPIKTVKYIAKLAKKDNKTVILNPAPYADLDNETLKLVDYIIPNEHELIGLVQDCDVNLECSIIESVHNFQKNIPINFVVTLGDRGVLSISKDGETISLKPHSVVPIDTVGAGDTFCGYFASSIASGKTLLDSLKMANKAASISVTRRGAAKSVPYAREVISVI